ncbi:AhpC Peroxiredoxin [Pyrenophora tritici-repentis]|nr:AhpC Peroxiredoxin [Pyrenophora tritici-repentis]KAI1552845.1 AhpC Peroxiredoxin [Pyrenophora tritici-repentis]KAI1558053.1 AhpC Peroxiredoxin [Pyrenophora tritici-repentis]KAI1578574.1 AhpC Peroxiredoxin [Pyrenophora tritici-repentis]PZD25875.1 AhpC, Peroxiredoxin [Pyrenophora tritici-repentis]
MSITSFDDRPGRGGFLTFNSGLPRIYLSCALPAPEKALLAWREEGYDTRFLPYDARTQSQAEYIASVKALSSTLNLGEHYALIAYGDAASVVLKTAQKPLAKCCAIIAFYPTVLPSPKTMYPNSHQLQVHIAGPSQTSPRPDMCAWKLYRYEKCATGFADPASPAYETVEANLAWTRTLSCVRKGFGKNLDLEPLAQAHWNAKFEDDDPDRASMDIIKNMTQDSPHVTVLPTLQGGVGRRKLAEFYGEFFVPSLVPDFEIRLVSRTMGVNRIVDEMVVSFTHSDEVDWILPGVKATHKRVEVAMAKTTHGDMDFYKFLDNKWTILFSHPADFTPVCTTELGAFAKLKDEFDARGVQMIGLSANDLSSHSQWIADINETSNTTVQFPIIADADRHIAFLYDMISQDDLDGLQKNGGIAFTIRSVFIIDPAKKIRLTMSYPASTGRNTAEVLRVIDSLQTGDAKGIATPIDWQKGQDVIVPPSVSTEDARKKFGEVREVKKYLRFTNVGK